jgi:nickel/cobalt transporter (NicO) family protein
VGLVPCTGSVLILLYAFANDILWAGLALVAAVAAGMAVTMGALGLASVAARRLLVARLAGGGGARALALVDVTGAALITAVGLFLLATSL